MILKQLCSPFEIGQSRQTEGKQRQQKLQIQLCSSTAVHLLFNHFDIIVKQYSARLLIFDRIQTFMKNRSFNRPDKSALNKLIAFFLPTPPSLPSPFVRLSSFLPPFVRCVCCLASPLPVVSKGRIKLPHKWRYCVRSSRYRFNQR